MTERDKSEFAACLKVAADLYGRPPLSTEALKMFFLLLQKFSLEQVKSALQEHMASSPYMPKPCDVIQRIEGRPEDRAAVAWALVLGAISRFGHDTSVRFPSPAFHYALGQMGGWAKLCMRLTDAELPFRARDFSRFFAMGERCASWNGANGTVKVPAYLAGTCELSNRTNGYTLPAKVYDAETGEVLEGQALPTGAGKVVPFMAALAERLRAGGAR